MTRKQPSRRHMDGMLRPCLAAIAFLLLAQPAPCAAQGGAPDPRFGIVETFVNPAAATEAGAGFTRVILRWDVIQPAGPADWKPANVPDPFIERELADGRQVVGLLIGTPAWASAGGTDGAEARPMRAPCPRWMPGRRSSGAWRSNTAAASATGSSGTSRMCGSPIIRAARGWAMRRITLAC